MLRFAAIPLVLLLAPAHVLADDSVGAVRIGAGVDLLGWRSTDMRSAMSEPHSEGIDVGIFSPSLTLDAGVQVHEWIAVGLLGGFRYADHTQPVTGLGSRVETWSTSYGVLAYVESSFRVELTRPFLRLCGGVQGTSAPAVSMAPGFVDVGTSSVEGVFTAMLGAHLFVVDDFSVSPYVSFTYAAGTVTPDAIMVSPWSAQVITLQIGVELLGWIATSTSPTITEP